MPYAEGHVARARPRVVKYLGVGRTHKIKKEERIAIIEIEIRYMGSRPVSNQARPHNDERKVRSRRTERSGGGVRI